MFKRNIKPLSYEASGPSFGLKLEEFGLSFAFVVSKWRIEEKFFGFLLPALGIEDVAYGT